MVYLDGYTPKILPVNLTADKSNKKFNPKINKHIESSKFTVQEDKEENQPNGQSTIRYSGTITCEIEANIRQCDISDKNYFFDSVKEKFSLEGLFDEFIESCLECEEKNILTIVAEYDLHTKLIVNGEEIGTRNLLGSEIIKNHTEASVLKEYYSSIVNIFNKHIEKNLDPERTKKLYSLKFCPGYFSGSLKSINRQERDFQQSVRNYFSDNPQMAKEFLDTLENINSIQDASEKEQKLRDFIDNMPSELRDNFIGFTGSAQTTLNQSFARWVREIGFIDKNGNISVQAYDNMPGVRCSIM